MSDQSDPAGAARAEPTTRRRLLQSLGATAAAGATTTAGCTSITGGSDGAETYRNPVFEPVLADPTVVRADDGTYYAYGTSDAWGDGEGLRLTPIVKSEDLVEWTYVGEAFESKPDWKYNGHGIWAPSIHRHDGEYLLYYSLFGPSPGDSAIGLATADSPEGPFTDEGRVVGGGGNSIDPFVTTDPEGTPYMFWGSYGQPIYAAELSEDRREVVGEWQKITRDGYEGPHVIRRDGYYYLFVSAGFCCNGHESRYRVNVGRSESLLGPYVDPDGADLANWGGETILQRDDRFAGPGHCSTAVDGAGNDWIVYHAYDQTEPEQAGGIGGPRRSLMIDRIEWEDGWPTINDGTPSEEAPAPSFGGGGLF